MNFKRIIALILIFAFLVPCLNTGALIFDAKYSDNPFYFYDKARESAIDKSLSDYSERPSDDAVSLSSEKKLPTEKRNVRFKKEVSLDDIYMAVKAYSFELLADSSEKTFSIYFETNYEANAFENKYASMIASFERDKYKKISAITLNDELSSDYWAYDSAFLYDSWEYGFGSRDVVIAVLDTGIFRNHEDFEGASILDGYDVVEKKNGVNTDVIGHGTKVTGIIAATPNNTKGISGVAPGCSILPVKITADSGNIRSSDFAQAVYFAADSGADIINLSFGGYDYVDIEAEAIKYANSKGCIVVASSGNEGNDKYEAGAYSYPASYDGVISVGACDRAGDICLFSQFNDKVDIAAPGADVITLNKYNLYSYGIEGTSFSCAFVSGAAGLLLSKLGDRNDINGIVFEKMLEAVSKTKYDIRAGWGVLDIYSLIEFTEKAGVIGVKNGETYFGNVNIWFMNGKAVLDGNTIQSGYLCKYSGKHTLKLTYGEETEEITFTTDNIPLRFDYRETSDGAKITFSRGKATLDGFPYLSGELVTKSGTHEFVITGPNGNTKTHTFTLDFSAPIISGIEDGAVYNEPQCITFIGEGKVTVNGASVKSGHVVSASGKYQIVSSAKNGKDQHKLSFTIEKNEDTIRYTVGYDVNQIFVSNDNDYAVLYNSAVRSLYVYSADNMKGAKKVLKLRSGVLGCFEYGDKLVAVHESTLSLLDTSALLVSGTPALTEIKNEHLIESCVYSDGRLFYIEKGSGTYRNVYEYSFESNQTRKVKTINSKISMICYDQTTDRLIGVTEYTDDYDKVFEDSPNMMISFAASGVGSEKITKLYFPYGNNVIASGGNVFIGANIFDASTHAVKLVDGNDGETPVFYNDGALFTDKYVYDTENGKKLGVNGSALYDIAFVGGKYYMLSESGIAISSELTYAPYSDPVMSETPYQRDEFRTELALDNMHSAWSIDEIGETVYCISDTRACLDIIDIKTLRFIDRVALKYLPSKVLYHNDRVIVMFKGVKELYFYDTALKKGYYKAYKELDNMKEMCADGDKLFILNGGDVYIDSLLSDDDELRKIVMEETIDAMTVSPMTHKLFLISRHSASINSEIIKYDTETLNLLSSTTTYQLIYKVICDDDVLLTENAAYSADTLELIRSFDSVIKAKRSDCVVTSSGLVSLESGTSIGRYDFSGTLVFMDDGYNCIMESNGVICKISCDDVSNPFCVPQISGADSGTNYNGDTVISFNTGVAFLNDVKIDSGKFVNDGGAHTLTVILPYNRVFIYNFAIDAHLESITIKNGDMDLKATEKALLDVQLSPKGAPAVEIAYSSSDPSVAMVDSDGVVTALNKGRTVISAYVFGGEYISSVTLTVSELRIGFKTDVFECDSGIIKGITPGITVSGIIGALTKECAGSAVILNKDGEVVKSGAIMTGMTISLLNAEGMSLDSAVLCVAGDTDGDGGATFSDYLTLRKGMNDPTLLSLYEYAASDINNDGKVNVIDMLKMENHILGRYPLSSYNPSFKKNEELSFDITTTDIIPGKEFALNIVISGTSSLYGTSAKLLFDSSLVAFKHSAKNDASWKNEIAVKDGELTFIAYDALGNEVLSPQNMTSISLVFVARDDLPDERSLGFTVSSILTASASGVSSCADKAKQLSVSDGTGQGTSLEDAPYLVTLTPNSGTLLPDFDSKIYDYVLFVHEDVSDVWFECVGNDGETVIVQNIPQLNEITTKGEIVCTRGDKSIVYNITIRKNVDALAGTPSLAIKVTFIVLLCLLVISIGVLAYIIIIYRKKRLIVEATHTDKEESQISAEVMRIVFKDEETDDEHKSE